MPAPPFPELKSADRAAFDHYLRTGERLTGEESFDGQKPNPHHDARGRFTSAPGVSVSYGPV